MPLFDLFDWEKLLTRENLISFLPVALLVVLGFPLLKLISLLVMRLTRKRMREQTRLILRKLIFYSGVAFIVINVLMKLNVDLTAIWGAAGIAGIAVGFASQTSMSNLISGLFLISEKHFTVGDVVQVGKTTGEVASVDLMSVKIRTFDNQLVRIPNATLLNTETVNVTRFPIRRMDLKIPVAFHEDLVKVIRVLKEICGTNEFVLSEPEPLFLFTEFRDSAIELLIGVWFVKKDFIELKNSLIMQIRDRFELEGIEMPYPRLAVLAESRTGPFPVYMTEKNAQPKP